MISEIKNALDIFFALIRIGSGKKLLIFDAIIWTLILIDLFIIRRLHLDIYELSFIIQNIWKNFSVKYIGISIGIIYIPPLLSAFVNFLFRDTKLFRKDLPTQFKDIIFIFHFITAIGFSFFISISSELQLLSGLKGIFASNDFFLSSFEYTPLYSSILVVIIGGIPFMWIFLRFISDYKTTTNIKEEFKLWFNLADISREYFPKQKSNLIYVNTASMAPSINWINIKEESYRNSYQKMVPTSDAAKKYLKDRAEDSRDFIREYLFHDSSDTLTFSIEFLPGTSRGLEVGLNQIKDIDTIILSPYEHPSQYDVVKWFVAASKQNINHKMLKMDYSILDKSWNEQKTWMVNLIKSALPEEKNKKIAILLSEVHYVSGLCINVREIIEELRPEYKNSKIVFIIDGSQSVGNLKKPFSNFMNCLHGEDFYYFSAHKWLLSPNTCGVLITRQNDEKFEEKPYDLFGADPPTSTIDPGVIFGIYSSLEFLIGNQMFYLNRFYEKSQLLKAYFEKRIGERFVIIKSPTKEMNESNFIALKPNKAFKWKDSSRKEFWEEITQTGVDLTLIPLTKEGKTWCLRISFPYFLQLHLLKQLIKHLNDRVEPFN